MSPLTVPPSLPADNRLILGQDMGPVEEVATRTIRRWRSRVCPDIVTDREDQRPVLEWADAHPVVFKVVFRGSRSPAFGPGSCVYIGWAQRNPDPAAVLERVRTLYELANARGLYAGQGDSIFCWRARFTIDHYGEPGFTGGTFTTMLPGRPSPLDILTLDYTPATVWEVAQAFAGWAWRGGPGVQLVVWKKYLRIAAYRWPWEEVRGL
jgi:hypothetical protein